MYKVIGITACKKDFYTGSYLFIISYTSLPLLLGITTSAKKKVYAVLVLHKPWLPHFRRPQPLSLYIQIPLCTDFASFLTASSSSARRIVSVPFSSAAGSTGFISATSASVSGRYILNVSAFAGLAVTVYIAVMLFYYSVDN